MIRVLLVFFLFIQSLPLIAKNQLNYSPLLAKTIVNKKLLQDEDFFLIDVGASRGIASYFTVFAPYLQGVGFDPLVLECTRLNSINPYPKFKYVPSFIVAEDENIDNCSSRYSPNSRSSSTYYRKIYNINYRQISHNAGQEIILTNERTSLDRYCSENGVESVDFIKVDTDGHDFGVLKGGENLLNHESLLGLFVESQFHGDANPYSNTFRNIDYLLVKKGFRLYDLTTWSYSRSSLPTMFTYKKTGHTNSGQLVWGDALYLRDLVEMKQQGKQIPTTQILKMICIQEIYGLYDCAAELLLTFREQLSPYINVDHSLNLLAKEVGLYKSYKEHMDQFRTNPKAFFPK